MNNQEYEQKKQECWEEYLQTHPKYVIPAPHFEFIFDRAYALGKQTETISQEEIEKACVEYADKTAKQYEVCNSEFVQEIMVAFEQGAKFTLGKQEKDAEKISSLEEEIHIYAKAWSFTVEDYTAIRKAVEYGVSLAESDADTVIQGWVARDKSGYLVLHYKKPHRTYGNTKWYSAQSQKSLPRDSFPDLTWKNEPIECEIIIKRKKK